MSARRYRIEGRLPSPLDDAFHARLVERRFQPLGPHEEHTFGWVSADNLLVTRFDADTVVRGGRAAIGLRVDRRRPDPRLLRARIDLEIDARRKAAGDGGRSLRIGRDERTQIKADVLAELLAETQPRIEAHTVLVHPKRRLLWMLCLARGANELLVRLVRDTFGVEVTPLTPWRRGQEILAGRLEAERLGALEPSVFALRPDIGAPASATSVTSATGRPEAELDVVR